MANVSIRDLAIDFGSINVLKSLNLEIAQGEFIVLARPVRLRQVHASQRDRRAA